MIQARDENEMIWKMQIRFYNAPTISFMLIVFLGFAPGLSFCQNEAGDHTIELDIKKIDSLSSIKTYLNTTGGEGQVKMVPVISEGTIENMKRKLKGGFSQITFANPTFDTLHLIQYSDNLEKYLIQTYYYKSNRLLASLIELKDQDKTIFRQQKYYRDDKIIFVSTEQRKLKRKYKWRIEFDPLESGYFYLKSFEEHRKIK
jgi:hypothetical protein